MNILNDAVNLAIITPVYNGKDTLWGLYQSIETQEYKKLTWIIVDDGSNDKTELICKRIIGESSFEVIYVKKKNGGKCRAINYAYNHNSEFAFYMIIDCDDLIIDGSLTKLVEKINEYKDTKNIGAIYCWREMKNDKLVMSRYLHRPKGDCVQTIYDRKRDDKTYGDGAIGYFNRFLKEYKFREFSGERFIGEITILLEAASNDYIADIVYVDFAISKGEYSAIGLSAQGRRLRLNNPYGMIYYSGLMQSKKMRNFVVNMKYAVSAQAYATMRHITKDMLEKEGISSEYLRKWAMVPGFILGKYWDIRYGGTV